MDDRAIDIPSSIELSLLTHAVLCGNITSDAAIAAMGRTAASMVHAGQTPLLVLTDVELAVLTAAEAAAAVAHDTEEERLQAIEEAIVSCVAALDSLCSLATEKLAEVVRAPI